jgi:hypothetical protein
MTNSTSLFDSLIVGPKLRRCGSGRLNSIRDDSKCYCRKLVPGTGTYTPRDLRTGTHVEKY